MKTIHIKSIPGCEEWRENARHLLNEQIHPNNVIWNVAHDNQADLLGWIEGEGANHRKLGPVKKEVSKNSYHVPKYTMDFLNTALCHKSDEKFALCYRVIWRVIFENRNLLHLKTDNDVIRLSSMVKAVNRDAYKMSAYLRFRSVHHGEAEHFIAWYEPEHYSLEVKLNFFKTRFRNMRWSIITPYRAAHWDTDELTLDDNPDPSVYPKDDNIEKYWLTYYANIFNPARPKKNAMLSAMPKKYWKNMPETVLIDGLLRDSEAKAKEMISKHNTKKI